MGRFIRLWTQIWRPIRVYGDPIVGTQVFVLATPYPSRADMLSNHF